MPNFSPIITDAYQEILERKPDPGGLANYNQLMNQSMTEADMRESLLRSPEYASKNPDPGIATRLGLNAHIPSNFILQDIAKNLGMQWIRIDFDWFRIEPRQGFFRWQDTDRVVDRASKLNLEPLATLSYTAPWASSNPQNPSVSDPPAETSFWTNIVREAVTRYREKVRFWQFWNEPNLGEFWGGSMGQYRTQILQPAARLAKEINRASQVVSPGLANLGNWRDWFEEAMKAKNLIDVINHHNYASNGRDVILELEEDRIFRPSLRTLLEDLGVDDKPFWITETGRATRDGDQVRYYEDVVATLRQSDWVQRIFFFHYWDGPDQGNGGFGIVNADFSPKPVYRFLQSVLRPAAAFRQRV
jgi:hypothetical protein